MPRRTYNKEQANYMFHKATVDALKEEKSKLEQDYIKKHGIVNPDGTIPAVGWMIDDDKIFNKMLKDIGAELNRLEIPQAEKELSAAEDALIKYGLSIMPKQYINEKKILQDVCFGLNGKYRNITIRKKFIEQTLRLDVTTVK